jgi:CDGSH-type Zn-finger protein
VAPNDGAALPEHGELLIKTRTNGPLRFEGALELLGADSAQGEGVHRSDEAVLCRCGGSATKPFCDGTHKRIGFQAE